MGNDTWIEEGTPTPYEQVTPLAEVDTGAMEMALTTQRAKLNQALALLANETKADVPSPVTLLMVGRCLSNLADVTVYALRQSRREAESASVALGRARRSSDALEERAASLSRSWDAQAGQARAMLVRLQIVATGLTVRETARWALPVLGGMLGGWLAG